MAIGITLNVGIHYVPFDMTIGCQGAVESCIKII